MNVVMTQQPLFYAQCQDICLRENIPLVSPLRSGRHWASFATARPIGTSEGTVTINCPLT